MSGPRERALHARASRLFLELRELPPGERESALLAAAPRDERLRAEVRSLLEHDAPGEPEALGASAAGDSFELPQRIGPYRVVRDIGRGGSGRVFLAEQEEPVRREVAIKVVPAAAHSPELAARLYVERRALERAEHPHVARILDAGRTDTGLPFLVMEFVAGPPITAYCARQQLSVAERVRLLLPVVDAVQHAHQRGVVHRDLKPANVLVTEVDGKPSPRVLDFGIAKPIAGVFAEHSPPTLGLPMGTPAYMAPEQTGIGGVDTRADVYALGALLYELVAGRPPIDTAGDPLEALRRIRECAPEPASRVRARDPELARSGAPRALLADLDVVLGKALEKDPERRYATASGFGKDLARALAREPIEARRPTFAYRAARFVERNRALSTAGLLALVALGVGVAGLGLGLREARDQRRAALDQRDTEYGINRFLIEDILLAASPDRAGPEATALDLLRRASGSVETRFPGRPLTSAAVHQALADTFAELGYLDEAEQHVGRALELRRAVAGASSREAVRSEIAAASLIARRQRYAEAEQPLARALARARLILGPDDGDLYTAANDLGVTLMSLGREREASGLLEEALAGRERLLGPGSREVFASLANLCLATEQCGDVERAVDLMREALSRAEALADPPRFTLLGLNNNLGAMLQDLDRDREAVPYLERASALADGVVGADHPATLTIRGNLAGLEAELGDPVRAAEIYWDVAARSERVIGPAAEDTLQARYGYWNALAKAARAAEAAEGFGALLDDVARALGDDHWFAAQTRASLADALLEAGLAEEALPHAERAEARLRELYGPANGRSVAAKAVLERVRARGRG